MAKESEARAGTAAPGGIIRRVTLTNADGLHARPAAELVKLASTFSQRVTVNGTDAKSLLAIMALGLVRGDEVEIAISGLGVLRTQFRRDRRDPQPPAPWL